MVVGKKAWYFRRKRAHYFCDSFHYSAEDFDAKIQRNFNIHDFYDMNSFLYIFDDEVLEGKAKRRRQELAR